MTIDVPKFITPDGFNARLEYLAQWEAYMADPEGEPEPDHSRLLAGAAHGPILDKRLVYDEGGGLPFTAVIFGSKLGPRDPRHLDLLDDLGLSLGVAFGGGISVNDTVRRPEGLAFPRAKLTKWKAGKRDPFAFDLARGVTNAPAGFEVTQRGDYHSLRRRDLALSPNVRSKTTRRDFIEAAAYAYERNHRMAGIKVSLGVYLAALRLTFGLADRWYGCPISDYWEAAE